MRLFSLVSVAISVALATPLNLNLASDTSKPTAFRLRTDHAFIQETLKKVNLYRSSIDLKGDSNANWMEGPPRANMTALAEHWAKHYDWFKTERQINSAFSHYFSIVEGVSDYNHSVSLHFIHERAADEKAIPLLLLHGWPSTSLEWSQVIPLLTSAEGSKYHIVAPDLPGFGFSPAPEYSGLGPKQMGQIFDKLMNDLGYPKYGVVSTDLGWSIGMWMSDVAATNIVGHFSDYFGVQPNATDLERQAQNKTSAEESAYISSFQSFYSKDTGYSMAQTECPLALAQALSDSPVGFAGWVWNFMHTFSDGYEYTLDQIIDATMPLWIPGTYGNLRAYWEWVSEQFFELR